jgi:DNA (cytosine-5)-methyltransferase 1
VACTTTTRVNASNQHYVIEKDMEMIERDTPMKGNRTEPRICTMVGRDSNNPKSRKKADGYVQMLEIGDDVINILTSVQKDNLVAEPNVLTPKRTEFGKKIRKKYESGEVELSRHDMTQLEPREDGVSNTITSVQKDNLLAEPMIYDDYNSKFQQNQEVIGTITTQIGNPAPRHGFKIVESAEPLRIQQATKNGFVEVMPGSLFDMSYPESKTRRGRVQEGGTVSPTLMASGEGSCLYEGKVEQSYRIRKLTPKECFRLQGWSDDYFEKAKFVNSDSQLYKQAGNGVTVSVIEAIARRMK